MCASPELEIELGKKHGPVLGSDIIRNEQKSHPVTESS